MKLKPRNILGAVAKALIITVVLIFLGVHSLNFFEFTFPAEQWYLAYLGFGLTSGGVLLYVIIFKFDAKTDLQKFIAFAMLAVSVIGEIATAGFGMQIEAMKKAGYTLTQSEFDLMVIAVQLLGFVHGIANLVYILGDNIIELFADEDGDGVPNIVDKDYKKKTVALASDTKQVKK